MVHLRPLKFIFHLLKRNNAFLRQNNVKNIRDSNSRPLEQESPTTGSHYITDPTQPNP